MQNPCDQPYIFKTKLLHSTEWKMKRYLDIIKPI